MSNGHIGPLNLTVYVYPLLGPRLASCGECRRCWVCFGSWNWSLRESFGECTFHETWRPWKIVGDLCFQKNSYGGS